MHAYAGSSSGVQAEVNKQTSDFLNHQSWNVPDFIGEFQGYGTGSAWQYAVTQFNQNGISWATWAYKATNDTVGDSWGIYDPISSSSPSKPTSPSHASTPLPTDLPPVTTTTPLGP